MLKRVFALVFAAVLCTGTASSLRGTGKPQPSSALAPSTRSPTMVQEAGADTIALTEIVVSSRRRAAWDPRVCTGC